MPTVSVKGLPQILSPAYNNNVWYFDSTNKGLAGYRYVIKVYSYTTTLLATYRFAPRPGDGYAVVDVTKLLKNFLSFDKTIVQGVDQIPNSWFGYYITVQDEYNTLYTYDDFSWYNGLTDLNSNVTLDTHNFNPGDQVLVSQDDGGALKPMLQGLFTVIDPTVAGTTDLYINIPFNVVGSGVAVGGTVIYADNRKTLSSVEYTTPTSYIFNGGLPFVDYPSYDYTNYEMYLTSTTKKFLTSIPRTGFKIYPTQDILLNFANNFHSTKKILLENNLGDKFSIEYGTITTTEPIMRANVSPSSTMTTVTGTAPLVKTGVTYYDVWAVVTETQVSEKIRFLIDDRCRISTDEILFLDRMGSFVSFAFELRNKVTNSNTKSSYRKLAGDLGTGGDGNPGYTYTLDDRGETVYNVDLSQTIELNTNWMDDASSVYFQELVSSPATYIKQNGVYQAVVVTDASMEEKRAIDKKLIRYKITVSISNNSNVNI